MEALLLEYLPILIFLVIAVGMSAAMIGASYLIRDERLENLLWEQREDD